MCLHLKVELNRFEKTKRADSTFIGWKVVTVKPSGDVFSWLKAHQWQVGVNIPTGIAQCHEFGNLYGGCFHIFPTEEDANNSLRKYGCYEQRVMKVMFYHQHLIATGVDDDGTLTGAVLNCWVDELPTY